MTEQIDRSAWFIPYAAGVVDSDGCITIKRSVPAAHGGRYYYLQIIVAQCCDEGVAPVIQALQEAFRGSISKRTYPDKRRTMWHWTVAARTAEVFLKQIQPYLIGKQDQAIAALEYRRLAVGGGQEKRIIAEAYYRKLRAFKNYTYSGERT